MTDAYLDYNATCPVRQEAVEAMLEALRVNGNASSVHAQGRRARRMIEDAREALAARVGANAAGVIFTSGGTEANALALQGFGPRRVIASAVEHPSVLKAADVLVGVDDDGRIDLPALERILAADKAPALVAVMLANNETGVVQPVAEAARLAHEYGAMLHCDVVQAFAKMPFDIESLEADSLAISAHKIGGPQGTGALVLADGNASLHPLIAGGGQEGQRRAGTENLPGIAGFAAVLAVESDNGRVRALRDRLERDLRRRVPGVRIFGDGVDRLVNTTCFALPGLVAETAVMALDLGGVMVSAGSACSSGKVAESHVLKAMGAGALAGSALRVSLGWASTDDDVDRFLEVFSGLSQVRLCRQAA